MFTVHVHTVFELFIVFCTMHTLTYYRHVFVVPQRSQRAVTSLTLWMWRTSKHYYLVVFVCCCQNTNSCIFQHIILICDPCCSKLCLDRICTHLYLYCTSSQLVDYGRKIFILNFTESWDKSYFLSWCVQTLILQDSPSSNQHDIVIIIMVIIIIIIMISSSSAALSSQLSVPGLLSAGRCLSQRNCRPTMWAKRRDQSRWGGLEMLSNTQQN